MTASSRTALTLAALLAAAPAFALGGQEGEESPVYGLLTVGTRVAAVEVELDAAPEDGGEGVLYTQWGDLDIGFDSLTEDVWIGYGVAAITMTGECQTRESDGAVKCSGTAKSDSWTRDFTLVLEGDSDPFAK